MALRRHDGLARLGRPAHPLRGGVGLALMGMLLFLPANLEAVPAPQDPVQPLLVAIAGAGLSPIISLGPLLEDPGIRRSLEAGLPIRIEVTTELWRDGTFDALEARDVWRATARMDPLSGQIQVDGTDGTLGSSLPLRLFPAIVPGRTGNHYYLARLVVETLSTSDLEELRRWLSGDLSPAVGASEDVGGAVTRGLRRFMVRLLGLPTQRHEARSPVFTVPP